MNYRMISLVAVLAFSLTACGGASSSSTPSSPTVTSTGSSTEQSVSTSGQSAGAAFPVALGSTVSAAAGIDATSITLPFTLPANTTVSATAAQPTEITAPFSVAGPVPQSERVSQSQLIKSATAAIFFVLTPSASIALSGNYTFSFKLHTTPSTTSNYYLAAYDGSKWDANVAGAPAAVSGNTLTFSGSFPTGFSLSANTHYALVLYTLPMTLMGSTTTASSGTPVTVSGLLDGGTSVTLPLSTTPVSLTYTSQILLGQNAPLLSAVNGGAPVSGYITVTPASNVTFLAGQSIVVTHPQTSAGTAGPGQIAGTGGNGASTVNAGAYTHLAFLDTSATTQAWVVSSGSYTSDGKTQALTYTLPANVTLKGNVTYDFAVYH